MSICTVVEFLLDEDIVVDLSAILDKITQTNVMIMDQDNQQWTAAETGDLIYWFDASSMDDEECDDDDDDEEDEEIDENTLGIIIRGPQKNKTAGIMVGWFMDHAVDFGLDYEDFTIMTYITEVDDEELVSIA